MPSGFDVESGAALSQRLRMVADWFLDLLKKRATDIPNPITGANVCVEAAQQKINLQGADVRAMVNYWRRNGQPIASTSDGYFYAKKRHHLDSTILHLNERLMGIRSALIGLEKAQKNIDSGQLKFL